MKKFAFFSGRITWPLTFYADPEIGYTTEEVIKVKKTINSEDGTPTYTFDYRDASRYKLIRTIIVGEFTKIKTLFLNQCFWSGLGIQILDSIIWARLLFIDIIDTLKGAMRVYWAHIMLVLKGGVGIPKNIWGLYKQWE